jgi:outer membrane biosynthesis protein TonB
MKNLLCIVTGVIVVLGSLTLPSGQSVADNAWTGGSLNIALQQAAPCDARAQEKALKRPVRLKITLLATGQVGPVTLVKRKGWHCLQELGLVDKAIEAAKRIQFKPKVVNGKPVTTVVTREYVFTRY